LAKEPWAEITTPTNGFFGNALSGRVAGSGESLFIAPTAKEEFAMKSETAWEHDPAGRIVQC
jgi:hypothetical protein